MNKSSFKDAVLKPQPSSGTVGIDVKYNYDECMQMIASTKTMDIERCKVPKDVFTFYDDNLDRIQTFLNEMKHKYDRLGFFSNMQISDVLEILMKYTTVEEVIEDLDEQECSFDEDSTFP